MPTAAATLRAASIIAALTLPWFAKSALTSGNPLFPMFGEWLGYGSTSAAHLAGRRSTLLQAFPVDRDPMGLVRWLAWVAFGPELARGGMLGPLPLALAPIAVQRTTRRTAVLCAVLALLVLLQFAFMRPVRFGAPAWAFLSLAAAVGGSRLARSGSVSRAVLAIGLACVAAFGVSSLAGESLERIAAIRSPDPYRNAAWPDQLALRELVEQGDATVAISMGAALWMPKPVYNLHWERNGEMFFRGTPPERSLALLRERGVRSLVVTVDAPLPDDGSIGHPTVDAWIREGHASLRADLPPRIKRGRRIWVLVDLR